MLGRFNPEKVHGTGGESPKLTRNQALLKHPLDHYVSSGVATVRRKLQSQFSGCGEFRENRHGLLWIDSVL
jgi:hypothetical protein